MIQKSKLTEKPFKKVLKQAVCQLKDIINNKGLSSKQKLFLSERLEEYKSTTDEHECENSSNIELRNMWGQKDLHSILRERNDRIFHLESEIEEYKNLQLVENRKKTKVDIGLSKAAEETIEEKSNDILKLKSENDILNTRIKEIELQMSRDREALDIFKESNKKLVNLSNQKKSPSVPRASPLTQSNIDNEHELSKLRGINIKLQDDLQIFNEASKSQIQRISNLEMVLRDMENRSKRASFPSDIQLNDMESVLVDELNDITVAFDSISETNKTLESQLALLMAKNSELVTENTALRTRIRFLDESKSFVDKERKRLEELKDHLLNESKQIQDRLFENERQCVEKDKKVVEYRMLLVNLQSSRNALEKEMAIVNAAYSSAQNKLHELKNSFNKLEVEHQNTIRLCESFKSAYNTDGEVVEDLERYKRILRCSVCDSNLKNCVLSKCMHTFCEDCILNQFKSRQRKCPSCQAEFNMNDVKRIFF